MLSLKLKVSRRLKSWNTNPRFFLRNAETSLSEMCTRLFPSRRISPEVGLSRVARIFRSVVFQEPLSPMMTTNSPFSTEKFTLDKACTLLPPKRVVYIFFRFVTSSNGMFYVLSFFTMSDSIVKKSGHCHRIRLQNAVGNLRFCKVGWILLLCVNFFPGKACCQGQIIDCISCHTDYIFFMHKLCDFRIKQHVCLGIELLIPIPEKNGYV